VQMTQLLTLKNCILVVMIIGSISTCLYRDWQIQPILMQQANTVHAAHQQNKPTVINQLFL